MRYVNYSTLCWNILHASCHVAMDVLRVPIYTITWTLVKRMLRCNAMEFLC